MDKTVVVFAIIKDNKILMEKRDKSSGWANELLFPGGVVEQNETQEMAMLREAMEELGIIPKEYFLIPTKEEVLGWDNIKVVTYYITDYQGEIPDHVLDVKNPLLWVDFDKVLNSKIPPVKKAAEAIKEYLKQRIN